MSNFQTSSPTQTLPHSSLNSSSNSIKKQNNPTLNHTITKSTQTSRVQNNQSFQCHHQDCLRIFSRKTSLTNHLKAHQNARSRSIYRTKRARQRAEEQRRAAATAAAVARMTAEEEQQSTSVHLQYSYQSPPVTFQNPTKHASLPPLQLPKFSSVLSNTTQLPPPSHLPVPNEVFNQDTDMLHASNNIIADNLRIEPPGNGTSPVSTNEAAYLTTNIIQGEQHEVNMNLLQNKVDLGRSCAESSAASGSKMESQNPISLRDNPEDDIMVQALSTPYSYLENPSFSECPGSLLHHLDFDDIGTSASTPAVELTNSSIRQTTSNVEPQQENNKNDDIEFFEEIVPLAVDFWGRVRPEQEIVDEICTQNGYDYNGMMSFS